ncbi:MAG: TetR/AcrR family transcriptional regulator [Lachnospiraceae bacterium]|nr:TetR/AcrR family transcriptional regulator [Lachnospiraceae bacterium]
MNKLSTRDRILDSALTLFSEKGYDGVGVDLIAENAGIKGPSLYRHFKGKEDILNCLIEKVGSYYELNFGSENRPGKLPESMEELIVLSLERIHFTMHDEILQQTRRIFAMEQFRNSRIAQLTSKHHLDGLQRMFQKTFEGMMENHVLKTDDAELLAMEFVAPVSLLIHIYDRQPERETEIMERIEKHLHHFAKIYGM